MASFAAKMSKWSRALLKLLGVDDGKEPRAVRGGARLWYLCIRISKMLREPLDQLFYATRTPPDKSDPCWTHNLAKLVFGEAERIAKDIEALGPLSV